MVLKQCAFALASFKVQMSYSELS